jgi:hypothetical protein
MSGDEYDGQWENRQKSGISVVKYAEKGVIQKEQWKNDVQINVIEVL